MSDPFELRGCLESQLGLPWLQGGIVNRVTLAGGAVVVPDPDMKWDTGRYCNLDSRSSTCLRVLALLSFPSALLLQSIVDVLIANVGYGSW